MTKNDRLQTELELLLRSVFDKPATSPDVN